MVLSTFTYIMVTAFAVARLLHCRCCKVPTSNRFQLLPATARRRRLTASNRKVRASEQLTQPKLKCVIKKRKAFCTYPSQLNPAQSMQAYLRISQAAFGLAAMRCMLLTETGDSSHPVMLMVGTGTCRSIPSVRWSCTRA